MEVETGAMRLQAKKHLMPSQMSRVKEGHSLRVSRENMTSTDVLIQTF